MTAHIVVATDPPRIACRNCRGWLDLELPAPATSLRVAVRRFERVHDACRPLPAVLEDAD